MTTKFFLCRTCGNVVVKVIDSGIGVSCCSEQMQELIPSTDESVMEKHLPEVKLKKDGRVKVKVGSMPHPMTEDHRIVFIYLEMENGGQLKYLSAGEDPEVVFECCGDTPLAVYAFCNIHGLWKIVLDGQCAQKSGCCE